MAYDFKPSPNHSSRNGTPISLIVLHATVGSYAASLAWLRNPQPLHPDDRVSTHYLISRLGHVAQLVTDDRAAWHAGRSAWRGRNTQKIQEASIGIELENKSDGRDPYPAVQIESCRLLVRSLIAAYSIARADLVRHLDIATPKGRKTDPAGFPWESFVASCYPAAPEAPRPTPAGKAYNVIGLPVYERPDRVGALWGYLLAGEHVTIDDDRGHLADGRGWIDVRGLVVRPL